MAKELPYFQFEPAEYLTKDISFCSLAAQGLFANICSYYWQRKCKLTKEQVLRRLEYEVEFNELVNEGVIDLNDGFISIKFLDNQYEIAVELSAKNKSNGSKGGAPKGNDNAKKENKKQPKNNPETTQKQGNKRNKIKEDNINSLKGREIDVETKDDQIKKLHYQNESEFLFDWNNARKHFEKKESNIIKLNMFERVEFNKIRLEFTINEFKNGIRGLFEQKQMYAANRLRPNHFLSERNIEKYIDCHLNKVQLFEDKKSIRL